MVCRCSFDCGTFYEHDSLSPTSLFPCTGLSETQVQWSPSSDVATRETWEALQDYLLIICGKIPERDAFPTVIDHDQALLILIHKNLREEDNT